MHAHPGAIGFVPLAATWFAMMTVMMAPAAWPWLRAFHRFGSNDRGRATSADTAAFAGGYLVAWAIYSAAAAAAQLGMLAQGWLDGGGAMTPLASGGILAAAGLFQFSAVKRACLTHCRSPFSYFLRTWRNAAPDGFRMGFGHGIFCVACCWAVMTTALAVGMANVWWMAALAAGVCLEQVSRHGEAVRAGLGVALIVGGAAQAVTGALGG